MKEGYVISDQSKAHFNTETSAKQLGEALATIKKEPFGMITMT